MSVDIYLDIETIPTQRDGELDRIRGQCIAEAEADSPPANWKDPDKIARWRVDRNDKAIMEADSLYRATALDGVWGEVVCIGLMTDDTPASCYARRHDEPETDLLSWLKKYLDEIHGGLPCYVGYNVQWDLRFLAQRYIYHNIRPRPYLPCDEPPWRDAYIDLRTKMYGARPGKGTRLKDLCRGLDIEVEADDIDGSAVWNAWQLGHYDQIETHNIRDVERVRELWQRMRP